MLCHINPLSIANWLLWRPRPQLISSSRAIGQSPGLVIMASPAPARNTLVRQMDGGNPCMEEGEGDIAERLICHLPPSATLLIYTAYFVLRKCKWHKNASSAPQHITVVKAESRFQDNSATEAFAQTITVFDYHEFSRHTIRISYHKHAWSIAANLRNDNWKYTRAYKYSPYKKKKTKV